MTSYKLPCVYTCFLEVKGKLSFFVISSLKKYVPVSPNDTWGRGSKIFRKCVAYCLTGPLINKVTRSTESLFIICDVINACSNYLFSETSWTRWRNTYPFTDLNIRWRITRNSLRYCCTCDNKSLKEVFQPNTNRFDLYIIVIKLKRICDSGYVMKYMWIVKVFSNFHYLLTLNMCWRRLHMQTSSHSISIVNYRSPI